jgi:DNA replication protein DnaC
MDLEFHQLDLRYVELRGRSPARERRLLSSLAEVGQQAPIVVVSPVSSGRNVVIDGYKRVCLLRRLGQDMVRAAENIVFIGPTGVGKTGLATGLLLKALQNGHRGLFVRAQDLFDEMYASLADRSSRKLLNRLARVDVLVIDEMGYLNLRPEQTNIFFKLMEERYQRRPTIIATNLDYSEFKLMEERYRRRPTIIATNLDYSEWANFLGNKSLVEALPSRLRHQEEGDRRPARPIEPDEIPF